MAWYDEAVFYHIYPLGLTGAPKINDHGEIVHRMDQLFPWIDHIRELGCTALYIGPLFESGSHGYDTEDYKKLDRRLGDNADLKKFVAACHKKGIKVIFDAVFNHVGRGFFAFQDLKENREHSRYKDWFCDVNFGGNTEYNDGFSYGNWGGYNLLVKMNQRNPEYMQYISDVIHFWVDEFDVDGLRLDVADVLDFDFMAYLRRVANEVKPDFWLMGEVIHGDYPRWIDSTHLHSVTNYQLHKAFYSGLNDHNFFEIAHTIRRLVNGNGRPEGCRLYNFVDNHDVERIYTRLNNKAHMIPVHILLFTVPGIPSIYYGSEFGIEGEKHRGGSDDAIRPAIDLEQYKNALTENPYTAAIAALGAMHAREKEVLAYGSYEELSLTTTQYAFRRALNGRDVIVTVNNADNEAYFDLPAGNTPEYTGTLFGGKLSVENGRIRVTIGPNSGEVWVQGEGGTTVDSDALKKLMAEKKAEEDKKAAVKAAKEAELAKKMEKELGLVESTGVPNKPYEEMSIEELQAAILLKMRKNGPVTDQMKQSVLENTHKGSLLNWVKSFR